MFSCNNMTPLLHDLAGYHGESDGPNINNDGESCSRKASIFSQATLSFNNGESLVPSKSIVHCVVPKTKGYQYQSPPPDRLSTTRR
mmetsp:Transcript_21275/g.44396  ORF Transcript_21275/g.44396 Transcript_21275/m.44396 type:complete len:86 (-) Transcript_21275:375-632(-)